MTRSRTRLFAAPPGPEAAKVFPDPVFLADVKCLMPSDQEFRRATGLPKKDARDFMKGRPIRKDRLEVARKRFYGDFGAGSCSVFMDVRSPWLVRRLKAAAAMIQAAGDKLDIPPSERPFCVFPPKSALRHACEVLEELVDTLCALHHTNPELDNGIYADSPEARRIVKQRYETKTGRSWYGSCRIHNGKLPKMSTDAEDGGLPAQKGEPAVQPADEGTGQPGGGEVRH